MAQPSHIAVAADKLTATVSSIFQACAVGAAAADQVAADLVAADLEGLPSHGIMLVPLYVKRLQAGSVAPHPEGTIISDNGTAIVIEAEHILGQLAARQAVTLACERAKKMGMATVAVRNAFHCGTLGRYARLMADQGAVGIVMANTRPLMPAPGGAEPLTGNNPLAIAVPGGGGFNPGVDMATSAAAMGKIRNAAAAVQAIPEGWAADREGLPTTDPQEAIDGMLLPAGGPKGYGLAFMIDLLAGGLSDGPIGAEVKHLYGDPAQPYGSSNLFIAIDVGHFVTPERFGERVETELGRIAKSRRAPGVERLFAPGQRSFSNAQQAGGIAQLPNAAWQALSDIGTSLNIDMTSCLEEGTST